MGARVRKFLPGAPITSVGELAEEVVTKRAYVLLRGRPMHPGWVVSMQFNCLTGLIRSGMLTTTVINPAWTPPPEKEAVF